MGVMQIQGGYSAIADLHSRGCWNYSTDLAAELIFRNTTAVLQMGVCSSTQIESLSFGFVQEMA